MLTYRGEQLALIPLVQPDAPSLVRFGVNGETTYTYKVVARRSTGHTEASPLATITTGPTTLTRLAAVDIVPPYVQGAEAYDIYRVSGGLSQGKIGALTAFNSGTTQQAQFRDHGQEGDSADAPIVNTTGIIHAGGHLVQRTMLTLSPDDIKDTSHPVYTVIPASGEGFYNRLSAVEMFYQYGSAVYDDSNSQALLKIYCGNGQGINIVIYWPQWTLEGSSYSYNPFPLTQQLLHYDWLNNQPITVVNDSGFAFTLGDGVLTLVFTYEVMNLATGVVVLIA